MQSGPARATEPGFAEFQPEPVVRRPSPQSNDVDIDERGLSYVADRNVGFDLLELRS